MCLEPEQFICTVSPMENVCQFHCKSHMQSAFNVMCVDFQGFRHLEMEPRPPWPDSGGDPFHSPGDGESMSARPYQVELLEKAKEKNIIVYLGTGSGKTFIAAMLMKHMKDKLLGGLQKV